MTAEQRPLAKRVGQLVGEAIAESAWLARMRPGATGISVVQYHGLTRAVVCHESTVAVVRSATIDDLVARYRQSGPVVLARGEFIDFYGPSEVVQ